MGVVVKQAASDMMDTNMRLYIDQQRSWAVLRTDEGSNESPTEIAALAARRVCLCLYRGDVRMAIGVTFMVQYPYDRTYHVLPVRS